MEERFRIIWRISFTLVLAVTLIVTTLGGIVGLSVREAYASGGAFGGGTGTPGDPYKIEDVADLQAMKNNLTAYYALSNDIDASATSGWNGGQGFEPIGDATNRFSGGFDGKGYTITGLYINRPDTNNVGMFGHVGHDIEATVIKNVHLVNTIIIGARGTGTLIGRVTGNANTLIENCSAIGGGVTGNGATGGLIGSFNSWRITPGGTDNPVLRYSYTNVAISSSVSGGGRDKFGGMAGCSQKGTIQNSYSRSPVNVTDGSRIGGLAGCIDYRGEILNSYSTGAVNVTNCVAVGGLVGNREGRGANAGVVTHSFWDIETSGQATSAGGTGKTTTEMKTEATFTEAGWNFDDIWNINGVENDGYPYLIWVNFVPVELTIIGEFTAKNKTYDATSYAEFDTYALALSGVAGGHDVSLVDVVIRFSDINVASNQTVNIASAALNGIDAGKYILTLVSAPTAAADIIRRDITVTADDKSKIRGRADPLLTYQITDGSLADDDEFIGELEREPGETVGSYDILQGTLAINDYNDGNNYDLLFVQGTFNITTCDECAPPVFCVILAASGIEMLDKIQDMREFRDDYLLTNPVGQVLVNIYYKISPPIAQFITEHPSLKPIVRVGLLPAVAISTITVNTILV